MSKRMSTRELINRGIACRHLKPDSICAACARVLAVEDDRDLASLQATVKALVKAVEKGCYCFNIAIHEKKDCPLRPALKAAKTPTAALNSLLKVERGKGHEEGYIAGAKASTSEARAEGIRSLKGYFGWAGNQAITFNDGIEAKAAGKKGEQAGER